MKRFANICASVSLLLAASLPFLSLFSADRNIDWQGYILIIAGGFGWIYLALQHQPKRTRPQPIQLLLVAFFLCLLLSLLVNPHLGYNLFGAPYIRLGVLSFLACLSCGLTINDKLSLTQLKRYLYFGISLLALLSIPYSLLKLHSLLRIGGIFDQADVMACVVGVGWLLGLDMLQRYPKRKVWLLSSQLLLAGVLGLTQTRAVIGLVIGLSFVWLIQNKQFRKTMLLGLGLIVILALTASLLPDRLTDRSLAAEGVSYRLTLQKYALKASFQKPVLGYGPGNLADALDCRKLTAPALQKTCHQGYFFNSSHNIFIDRILSVGWFGGLAFLGFVVVAVYRVLRGRAELQIFGYTALLIAAYYCTNVTSATLELLFWVMLMQAFSRVSA